MTVKLYKTSAPPNKVDKALTLVLNIDNAIFKEKGALDILKPSVLLNGVNDIEQVGTFNYCYIAKFSRYYFIDAISTEGGLVRIDCRCDALMSHKADIYKSKQYVLRQEKKYMNPYLLDNLLPIRSDHNYRYYPFGSDVFNKSCGRVILATAGKGGRII